MRTYPPFSRPRGFTLVEIAMVLLIIGVMIAMAAAITRGVAAAQKRSLTATRVAMVDAALLQFVTTQRRLPCPADGTLASSAAMAGTEVGNPAAGCTGDQANGVVPWRALALTELEITDGYERRMTYRVQPALAVSGIMDMTWCDAAGSGAAIGAAPAGTCNNNPAVCGTATPTYPVATVTNCTSPNNYLQQKGLQVRDLGGNVLMNPAVTAPHTGAAYVLISHGESGGGGYLNSGTLGASASIDGTEEAKNYANLPYVAGTSYYVDNTLVDTPGPGHFDDVVSRPSVMSLLSKAGLGPRAH